MCARKKPLIDQGRDPNYHSNVLLTDIIKRLGGKKYRRYPVPMPMPRKTAAADRGPAIGVVLVRISNHSLNIKRLSQHAPADIVISISVADYDGSYKHRLRNPRPDNIIEMDFTSSDKLENVLEVISALIAGAIQKIQYQKHNLAGTRPLT